MGQFGLRWWDGRPSGVLLTANRFHGVAKGEKGVLWCHF